MLSNISEITNEATTTPNPLDVDPRAKYHLMCLMVLRYH